MASNDDLPEGTDRLIPGAGISGADEKAIVAEREDGLPEDVSTPDREATVEPAGGHPGDAAPKAVDRPEEASSAEDAGTEEAKPDPVTAAAQSAVGGDWTGAREKLTGAGTDFAQQATDRVREFAVAQKDRAVASLDSVAKLIEDAAATVDDKVGDQYGAYVRQAGEALGSFTNGIRNKDVDELFTDLRDAVKKSPGVAVGTAAAVGFVLARIIKAGFDAAAAPAETHGGSAA